MFTVVHIHDRTVPYANVKLLYSSQETERPLQERAVKHVI